MISRNEKQIPSEDAPLMAFVAEFGVVPKGDRYDRSFLVKSDTKLYKRTELNDFIYSSNNLDVGSIGLNKYGTAVISDVYEIFSIKQPNNPTFISELIQRPSCVSKILKYRQGCLYGQYRIYAEDFLSVDVMLPHVEEQEKIATFIELIDSKIDKQRQLVELLKKYKKRLLKSVFDRETKFEEFSNWDRKMFSEVATLRKAKYTPSQNECIPCIELEHIEQQTGRIIGYVESSKQNSVKSMFNRGDVLFGKLRPYLRKYALPNCDGVCSSEIWVLHPFEDIDSTFLFYLVQSEGFINVANISSGTKMPRAEWSKISSESFFIPKLLEQTKIAELFIYLDKHMVNSSTTLVKLEEFKQGLLQQLFI